MLVSLQTMPSWSYLIRARLGQQMGGGQLISSQLQPRRCIQRGPAVSNLPYRV